MAANSRILIGAMVVTAAMVVALPVAKAIDAATLSPAPSVNVNRAAKGDRLASDQLASRRQPTKQMPVQLIRKPSDPKQKQQLMDGCDPLFSPVAVPQMAHVSGRCVG
jgi:hypothetical protein